MEILKLKEIRCNHFSHNKTVIDWHFHFKRRKKKCPNPKCRVKDRMPPFLSDDQDVIEAIKCFFTEHINYLTAERVHDLHESILIVLV